MHTILVQIFNGIVLYSRVTYVVKPNQQVGRHIAQKTIFNNGFENFP